MLFLLNSFSAMLPGLSYSEGGYPSGYTKQEYFRCERNAIPSSVHRFSHTTSDFMAGIGASQFVALQSSFWP